MVDLPNIALFHEKERYGNSNYPTQDPTIHKDYETFRNDRCTDFISNDKPIGVNDAWNKVKTCLLISVEKFVVGIGVVEFGMLKLGGGIMM